jgi:hypothetical protein
MESKHPQELDHIVNNLVKKLDYDSLRDLSVKLQVEREGKINYAEQCVEQAFNIVKGNKNVVDSKENMKKIAQDKFSQSYSSEYNDNEEWIDFFIEKQSKMFYDDENFSHMNY